MLNRLKKKKSALRLSLLNNFSPKRIFISFIFASLFIGLIIFDDYGIGWDEPALRLAGIVSAVYILKLFNPSSTLIPSGDQISDPSLISNGLGFDLPYLSLSKYYGVAFELPAVIAEKIFQPLLGQDKNIYLFRHLLIFLVFIAGLYFLWKIANIRFKLSNISIAAPLALILSPRIFADSFYNSRDIVFLSVYLMCLYFGIKFINSPNKSSAILVGAFVGLASSIRIFGLIVIFILLLLTIQNLFKKDINLIQTSIHFSLMSFTSLCALFLTWPYSWKSPGESFFTALKIASDFPWEGNVRFLGQFLSASELPWYYTIVWIVVSTPILTLALGSVGIFNSLRQQLKKTKDSKDVKQIDYLMLLALFLPLIIVALSDSSPYDGWRHSYFVLGPFGYFVSIGVQNVIYWINTKEKNLRKIFIQIFSFTLVFQIFLTINWMQKNHPLQNVYFNSLIRGNALEKFDIDYWGLSNRSALEYILKNDKSEIIKIYAASETPLFNSTLLLSDKDKTRINLVDNFVDADYVITNYRGIFDPKKHKLELENLGILTYEIVVDETTILSIFKIH